MYFAYLKWRQFKTVGKRVGGFLEKLLHGHFSC